MIRLNNRCGFLAECSFGRHTGNSHKFASPSTVTLFLCSLEVNMRPHTRQLRVIAQRECRISFVPAVRHLPSVARKKRGTHVTCIHIFLFFFTVSFFHFFFIFHFYASIAKRLSVFLLSCFACRILVLVSRRWPRDLCSHEVRRVQGVGQLRVVGQVGAHRRTP